MSSRLERSRDVLVDMDGVLADFDGAVMGRLASSVVRVPRNNFYFEDDYPDHVDHVKDIINHPDFFFDLGVIDGALEGWQRIRDQGFNPRICSAPLYSNVLCVEGKRSWLRKHLVPEFGRRVLDDAILDTRKYRHYGVVLIDDKPDVDTNNGQAEWEQVVFDQIYNKDSPPRHRLYGWRDPELENILESVYRETQENSAS